MKGAYNYQGEHIQANTVFILKHIVTGEVLAIFSSKEVAMANRHNVTAFPLEETFIQETIIDYYVSATRQSES
jgi:hypothetical protein